MFFFSSRRRHTRCALVTGVQTCALPISDDGDPAARKIDTLLRPSRRVTPIAFERRDSSHIGNIRLRCESQSGQKEVCRYSFPALKLQAPPSSLFIEPCALDPRSHPHKRPKAQRIANMPEKIGRAHV